jgi:hypothetical protein
MEEGNHTIPRTITTQGEGSASAGMSSMQPSTNGTTETDVMVAEALMKCKDKKLTEGQRSMLHTFVTHKLYKSLKIVSKEIMDDTPAILCECFKQMGIHMVTEQVMYKKECEKGIRVKINQLRAYSIRMMKKKYMGK